MEGLDRGPLGVAGIGDTEDAGGGFKVLSGGIRSTLGLCAPSRRFLQLSPLNTMIERFISQAPMRAFILFAFVILASLAGTATAQSFSQTSRAFVPSPQALAMGDAGVAFPTRETVFFYNPAHLSRAAHARPQISLLGVRGSLSNNVFDQLAFFEDELQPAISEGLDSKSNAELRSLYDETLSLGRARTIVNGDVLLPSVIARVGDVGFGAGAFGHSTLHYQFRDAGAGLPLVDFSAIADLIVVGSASLDFARIGVNGLSVGVSAKMTERWLTLKQKPLDAIGSKESVNVFRASAAGLDAGVLYELDFLPIPGNLAFGAAAYDVAGSNFNYRYDSNLAPEDEIDADLAAEEEALANALYGVEPSYRIGAAYMAPGIVPGVFKNTGITVDYLWYADPRVAQEKLAHLHIGAQAQIGFAVLRTGLNGGYTTFGGGLHFGFVTLDYAYYGVEQGRFPGQLASWSHSAQIAFRL